LGGWFKTPAGVKVPPKNRGKILGKNPPGAMGTPRKGVKRRPKWGPPKREILPFL